jgi:protein pelota
VALVQHHPERELGNGSTHLHRHGDLMNTLRRVIWFEHQPYGSYIPNSADENNALNQRMYSRVQNVSTTGTVDSQRIRTNLTIRVAKVEFSAAASGGNLNEASAGQQPNSFAALHISGRVAVENVHVKMNAFHTLDIEVGRDVRIEKDEWDSIALATVRESCIPGRGAEVGAIVCGEGQLSSVRPHRKRINFCWIGTAAFCLLSQHMTVVRQRIDVSIPRKMSSSSSTHEKGLARFYDAVYTTFLRLIPYASASLRAIVIASPGWVKDSVMDYIFKEATRTGNKALLAVRNKFIKIHVNSPHVHSLTEVLKSPEVTFFKFLHENR